MFPSFVVVGITPIEVFISSSISSTGVPPWVSKETVTFGVLSDTRTFKVCVVCDTVPSIVIVVLPTLWAVIIPSLSTVAILSSFEVYVTGSTSSEFKTTIVEVVLLASLNSEVARIPWSALSFKSL